MERSLPQSIEAEEGALGSLIIDPEAIVQVFDILRAEDFYRDAHRTIYRAILDLYTERGPADLITLCKELERRGQLDETGGQAYIASLVNAVPTSANIEYYARIVVRTAIARRLIHAAGQIAGLAYNEVDEEEMREKSMELVLQATTLRQQSHEQDFGDVLNELVEETYRRMEGTLEQHLLLTGIPELDATITGMERGELIFAAGRPGTGKSVLGLMIAEAVALQIKPQKETVYYYTLEMSATQQVRRLIAAHLHMNGQLIRAGFRGPSGRILEEALERFDKQASTLREQLQGTLFIHSKPISVDSLYQRLMLAVSTRKCRFVVIDQMDLFEDPRRDKEHEQISYASKRLKQIARDLNITILCLVQLSREVERRPGLVGKRPILSDLRYSGRLEQDADQVWFLFRPSLYEERPTSVSWSEYGEIILAKVRDGQRGKILPYRFLAPFTAIEPWPQDWERPTIEM